MGQQQPYPPAYVDVRQPNKWCATGLISTGKIKVEGKDEMKARDVYSHNLADAHNQAARLLRTTGIIKLTAP